MSFDMKRLTEKKNQKGISFYIDTKGDLVLKECSRCGEVKGVSEFRRKKELMYGVRSECKKCSLLYDKRYRDNNREEINKRNMKSYYSNREIILQRRRELRRELRLEIIDKYRGKCALSGDGGHLELDHVIPKSLNRGCDSIKNVIPIRGDLNSSKHNRNIFEWFADNRERFGLSQRKFDELIEYLADINEMTVEEYRDYVYWCHDNPRTVGEITEERAKA